MNFKIISSPFAQLAQVEYGSWLGNIHQKVIDNSEGLRRLQIWAALKAEKPGLKYDGSICLNEILKDGDYYRHPFRNEVLDHYFSYLYSRKLNLSNSENAISFNDAIQLISLGRTLSDLSMEPDILSSFKRTININNIVFFLDFF